MMTKQTVLGVLLVLAPMLLGADGGCEKVEFKLDLFDQREAALPPGTSAVSLDVAENGDVLVCGRRTLSRAFFPAEKERSAIWTALASATQNSEFLRAAWGPRPGEVLALMRRGRRQDVYRVVSKRLHAVTNTGDVADFATSQQNGLCVVRPAEHAGWLVEWPQGEHDRLSFRAQPLGVLLRDRWLGAPTLLWAEQREHGGAIWALPLRDGSKKRPVASTAQPRVPGPMLALPDGTVGWTEQPSTLVICELTQQNGRSKRVKEPREEGELVSGSQSGRYVAGLMGKRSKFVRFDLRVEVVLKKPRPASDELPE